MLPDSHAAGIVNGVRDRAWNRADAGLAKTLDAIKPTRLQAVDIDLRYFRNVHDGRQSVGQVADAVVARAREFAVPRNAVGGELRALYQRSHHIGFGDQRIDDDACVVRIYRSHEAPIAGPSVDFHFGETGAQSFIRRASFASRNASALLPDGA